MKSEYTVQVRILSPDKKTTEWKTIGNGLSLSEASNLRYINRKFVTRRIKETGELKKPENEMRKTYGKEDEITHLCAENERLLDEINFMTNSGYFVGYCDRCETKRRLKTAIARIEELESEIESWESSFYISYDGPM